MPFSLSPLFSCTRVLTFIPRLSPLAIFHASTGWHVRRRILRNSMEIARVPETALERISRHRVSQRADSAARYSYTLHCGHLGERTVKLTVIEGETDRESERPSPAKEREREIPSVGDSIPTCYWKCSSSMPACILGCELLDDSKAHMKLHIRYTLHRVSAEKS